jgi:outer membrane protein
MKTKLSLISLAVVLLSSNIAQAKSNSGNPDWIVRGRALYVQPDTKGKASTLGGNIAASSAQVPEIDITKFIAPNLALELIAATTKHDISLRGSPLAGSSTDLGTVKLLPPTLTLQYHANPTGTFRPYAGAGLNYTFFYGSKAQGTMTNVKYQDHLGYALQAGFDYMIDEKVGINFDIKKIFLKTRAAVTDNANKHYNANVRLDPWLIGAGISYHF